MTLSTYPISNGLPAFNLGPSFLEYAIQREMKMASIKENLIAAKELIDTPEKWIKGTFHVRLPSGTECYCAAGALIKATSGDVGYFEPMGVGALRHALLGFDSITGFNDAEHTTHADVMALFDRAIAAQDELA